MIVCQANEPAYFGLENHFLRAWILCLNRQRRTVEGFRYRGEGKK